jgi:hypothetical protein
MNRKQDFFAPAAAEPFIELTHRKHTFIALRMLENP